MKESSYHKKLEKIVSDTLYPMFRQAAVKLLMDALNSKEHGDLTGNTLTSFTAGIYNNGALHNTINILDVAYLDHPVYKKLSNDDGVVSIERYDNGNLVTVNTDSFIATDKRFGIDSAKSFLMSYIPQSRKGWSLVITTGTEYSEYIEESRHLNVLTETFLWADSILKDVFKK